MNKDGEEKSISSRTTPMYLNQRTNEKMRKAHRSISDKRIQKCTSLQRNGVQMRDRPDWMARNPNEKIMNLGLLVRGDPRIRIPLERSTSNNWHNVIKGRRLIVRINRMLDQWHPKSSSHYRRSNGVLFTPYPTSHQSVRIIGVDREIQVELFDQGSRKGMRTVQQR